MASKAENLITLKEASLFNSKEEDALKMLSSKSVQRGSHGYLSFISSFSPSEIFSSDYQTYQQDLSSDYLALLYFENAYKRAYQSLRL